MCVCVVNHETVASCSVKLPGSSSSCNQLKIIMFLSYLERGFPFCCSMSLTVKDEMSWCSLSQSRMSLEDVALSASEVVSTCLLDDGTVSSLAACSSLGDAGGDESLRVKVVILRVEGDDVSLSMPVDLAGLIAVKSNWDFDNLSRARYVDTILFLMYISLTFLLTDLTNPIGLMKAEEGAAVAAVEPMIDSAMETPPPGVTGVSKF